MTRRVERKTTKEGGETEDDRAPGSAATTMLLPMRPSDPNFIPPALPGQARATPLRSRASRRRAPPPARPPRAPRPRDARRRPRGTPPRMRGARCRRCGGRPRRAGSAHSFTSTTARQTWGKQRGDCLLSPLHPRSAGVGKTAHDAHGAARARTFLHRLPLSPRAWSRATVVSCSRACCVLSVSARESSPSSLAIVSRARAASDAASSASRRAAWRARALAASAE